MEKHSPAAHIWKLSYLARKGLSPMWSERGQMRGATALPCARSPNRVLIYTPF